MQILWAAKVPRPYLTYAKPPIAGLIQCYDPVNDLSGIYDPQTGAFYYHDHPEDHYRWEVPIARGRAKFQLYCSGSQLLLEPYHASIIYASAELPQSWHTRDGVYFPLTTVYYSNKHSIAIAVGSGYAVAVRLNWQK